jgi:hypothetical protein
VDFEAKQVQRQAVEVQMQDAGRLLSLVDRLRTAAVDALRVLVFLLLFFLFAFCLFLLLFFLFAFCLLFAFRFLLLGLVVGVLRFLCRLLLLVVTILLLGLLFLGHLGFPTVGDQAEPPLRFVAFGFPPHTF